MDKKIIIIIAVVLLVVLAAAGYFWFSNSKKPKSVLENAGDAAQKITNEATKGVLPSFETNPLENKPNINPADKANPIKNIKTNPFE